MSAGLDEVGMGSLAGPLTIVVAVFDKDTPKVPGVADSKKLTPAKREALVPYILKAAEFVGVGWAHPRVIDEFGMAEAWNRAASDALEKMPKVDLLVVDGTRRVDSYKGEQDVVVRGDDLVWHVSAASVLAKVIRDLHMKDMAEGFKGYDWESNKGYGSKKHMQAIKKLGPCSYHRKSFLKK